MPLQDLASLEFSAIGNASMSRSRAIRKHPEPVKPHGGQLVTCPRCAASFAFSRSAHPAIDASGFESYTFACGECGASLSGIVDPLDDALLITEVAA
jgi:transcription elongation factor Elf1